MDVPLVGPVVGLFAGLAWRGFETFSQISFRCVAVASPARVSMLGALPCLPGAAGSRARAPGQLTRRLGDLAARRNQVLVATDWARTKLFGRDTSRV